MQLFVISCFLCYIIFLFYLYRLGKEDFILIRKNIALEQLFNITLVTTLVGLFTARLLYVIFHFNLTFLNPLKFFIVPYFPGLIFPAAIAGGYAYIWYAHSLRKLPSGRLIDFYALALLSVMPLLTLFQLFLPKQQVLLQVLLAFIYFCIFLLFRFLLLTRLSRGEIKDGTLGFVFLGVVCTAYFLQNAFFHTKGIIFFLQLDDFFYLLMLLSIIIILYFHEFKVTKRKR